MTRGGAAGYPVAMTKPVPGNLPDPRLRCPKDAMLMEKVKVGSITIDRCAGCAAMWFDAKELAVVMKSKTVVKALDHSPEDIARAHAVGAIVCPRDKTPLRKHYDPNQPHVETLVCPTCAGVLLDSGELKDLSEFTLRERLSSLLG